MRKEPHKGLAYIRATYKVPAKRGMAVILPNGDKAMIIGTSGPHLKVRSWTGYGIYHPTSVEYLSPFGTGLEALAGVAAGMKREREEEEAAAKREGEGAK